MTSSNSHLPLTCVMPDCDEELYLVWDLAVPLTLGELAADAEPIQPGDAHTGTWKVECLDGHVVLVPGPEEIGDDESACAIDECDHDHSDELRTWRRADVDRLAALLARMGGGSDA